MGTAVCALGACVGDLTGSNTDAGTDASFDAGVPADTAPGDVLDAAIPCNDADASDPKNCGWCGHDCLGGACTNGKCQPVVLYTNPQSITSFGIAVDAKNVYFGVRNAQMLGLGLIQSCPLSGCPGNPVTLASNQAWPGHFAMHGGILYWSNATTPGGVWSCNPSDCAGTLTQYTSGENGPDGVAVDDAFVYWVTYPDSVRVRARDGGAPVTLATAQPYPSRATVWNGTLYWANSNGGNPGGNIASCKATGCGGTPTIEAPNRTAPTAIATDGTNLYWTEDQPGNVMQCTLGNCQATVKTLATLGGSIGPRGLTVDATNVYFTNSVSGTVMRCAIGGCNNQPTTVASGQSTPAEMANDGVAIYWTQNTTPGAIMRLAK